MVRTRVRWGRTAAAIVAAVLSVAILAGRAGAGSSARGPGPQRRNTYVVREGDTLWGIASRLVGPEGDPRPVVDRLASTNHAEGGLIRVGQVLVLPDA